MSALLAALAACAPSGGGGAPAPGAVLSESEPNGTPAAARALAVGRTGRGRVSNETDVDFWSVELTDGQVVSIEVFASRFDQAEWVVASNSTALRVFDPDGVSVLLAQSDEDFGWNSNQDTDAVAFRAPAAGTYYLELGLASAPGRGAEYLVAVSDTTLRAPLQTELEPEGVAGANDGDATAELLAPGTMLGFFVDDETDWYTFTVAAPSLVTFTMRTHRNGVWKSDDAPFDPELRLRDGALAVLASNDDTYYLDSSIQHLLTTAGDYYIEVLECCGTGDAGYQLEFELELLADLVPVSQVEPNDSVASAQAVLFGDLVLGDAAPGDDDVFALSCSAGERIYVQVFDASNFQGAADDVSAIILDASATPVPFEASAAGLQLQRSILTRSETFFVRVTAPTLSDYALRFSRVPAGFESEPNDAAAEAGTFDAEGRVAGVIDAAGDVDSFAFEGTARVPVFFHCLAGNVGPNGFDQQDGFGSVLTPRLTLRDAAGTLFAFADSTLGIAVGVKAGLSSVSLAFVPPRSGTWFLEVVDEGGAFGDDFTYVIEKR